MSFLIVLMILVAVVLLVSSPLWRGPKPGASETEASRSGAQARAELEAAREAKYREIRDAELDHRTGKLSDEDFAAVDRGLRAEAITILEALDHLSPGEPTLRGSGYHRPR